MHVPRRHFVRVFSVIGAYLSNRRAGTIAAWLHLHHAGKSSWGFHSITPVSGHVSTRRSKFYPLTFLESSLIHNSHWREKRACRVAYCQPESESSDGRNFYPRSNVKLTNTVRINHHDPQNQITLIQLLTITEGLKRELCTQQKVPGQNLI